MKRSLLETYALAVCFIGVIAMVISLSIGSYNLIEYFNPELAVDQWEYEQHSSNDKFWENHPTPLKRNKIEEETGTPSETELTKLRTESYNLILKSKKRRSTQTLLQTIVFLLISTSFFFIHWKIFKKSQQHKLN